MRFPPNCLKSYSTIDFLTRKKKTFEPLFVRARKKSTKIKFLGPETARWGGGLPRERVVAEKFVPSLESLSSLGFEERNLGCPGNFAGMSQTCGVFKNFVHKKGCAHFSFPICGVKKSLFGPLLSHFGGNPESRFIVTVESL